MFFICGLWALIASIAAETGMPTLIPTMFNGVSTDADDGVKTGKSRSRTATNRRMRMASFGRFVTL